MLVLTRKQGEAIIIGDQIKINVLTLRGRRVSLGVDAPAAVRVVRTEIAEKRAPHVDSANAPQAKATDSESTSTKEMNPMSDERNDLSGLAVACASPKDSIAVRTRETELPRQSTRGAQSVLLAEDDEEMRAVLAMHLRRGGYAVTECRNGVELVDHLEAYLQDADGGERFDLIISDIRMPGVFGLTVAEGAVACRDFPPIILITAFGDAETHATARRCAVRAIFDKPFAISEFLSKVREVTA